MGKTIPETQKPRNPEEKLEVDRYFKDINRPQTPEERAELVGLIEVSGTLESLEKAGKLVKKAVDNVVRYYPAEATA